MSELLHVHPTVRRALDQGSAVVALESTIIAHGMPFPRNLQTARRVEATIRDAGAVPATLAILDGVPRIGLSDDELELLARAESVAKVSRRDLPVVMARGEHGATTVAATMILAHAAGIRVFVTGGIGGVHRGAAETFDISADLEELARTPVAVVCAGAKSILDLDATLEVLETRGVPVLGHGTDRFPAFFTRDSGLPLDRRVDSAAEIASILKLQWALGLDTGAVIANPVPEDEAMAPEEAEAAVAQALHEAETSGLRGKAVTPFLLERVDRLTGGASLDANIALVLSNARLGAEIALALEESGATSPA